MSSSSVSGKYISDDIWLSHYYNAYSNETYVVPKLKFSFSFPEIFWNYLPPCSSVILDDGFTVIDSKEGRRFKTIFRFFNNCDIVMSDPQFQSESESFLSDYEKDPKNSLISRGLIRSNIWWKHYGRLLHIEQHKRLFCLDLLKNFMQTVVDLNDQLKVNHDVIIMIPNNIFYKMIWMHFTLDRAIEPHDSQIPFFEAAKSILHELTKGTSSRIRYGWSLKEHDLFFLDLIEKVYPAYLDPDYVDDAVPVDEDNEEEIANDPKIFLFDNADDLIKNIGPPEFLIDKYFEKNTIGQIFGDYATYKTFVAISIACSVATGVPWMGHKVKQGPVFYLLGEGRGGFGRRLAAWTKKYGVDDFGGMLHCSQKPAQLTDEKSAKDVMYAMSRFADKLGPPALIVIDTLNRNFGGGNENSTEDMTQFVANLDAYIKGSANILILHHTGHANKERGRGSIVLPAALDTGFRIDSVRPLACRMTCTKMKDAQEPATMNLTMEPVVIGFDDESQKTIDSLVAVYESTGAKPKPVKLSGNTSVAYDELVGIYKKARKDYSAMGLNPNNVIVKIDDWKKACSDTGFFDHRKSFYRAKTSLMKSGMIHTGKLNVHIVHIEDLLSDNQFENDCETDD